VSKQLKALALPALVVAAALTTSAVSAQAPGQASGGAPKEWDVTLGAGLALRPTYEGSDRYTASPLPILNVTYRDWLSLGTNGLSAYLRRDALQVGAGLTYGGGRDEKDDSMFGGGDKRLKGMGKIDGALGLRAFAVYDLKPIRLSASVTKFTGDKDKNDGAVVEIGAAYPVRVTNELTVTPNIGASWADENYMQSYFGVTSQQAARSRFTRFTAEAGLKDVSVGVNANYRFTQNWFAGASATMKQLASDAAKSPLSFADTQGVFLVSVGYRF
jgi:outer membrane protein